MSKSDLIWKFAAVKNLPVVDVPVSKVDPVGFRGVGRAQPEPFVGQGATSGFGGDRYPYTVIQVINKRRIVLQLDSYKRLDKNGLSESQTYEYTRNPNSSTYFATLRKDGTWVRKGEPLKRGQRFWLGHRQAYQDPSF